MKLLNSFILFLLLSIALTRCQRGDQSEGETKNERDNINFEKLYKTTSDLFDDERIFLMMYLKQHLVPFTKQFLNITKGAIDSRNKNLRDFVQRSIRDMVKDTLLEQLNKKPPPNSMRTVDWNGNPSVYPQIETILYHDSKFEKLIEKLFETENMYKFIARFLHVTGSKSTYEGIQSKMQHFKSQLEKQQAILSSLEPYQQIFEAFKNSTILMLLRKYPKNQDIATSVSAFLTVQKNLTKIIKQVKKTHPPVPDTELTEELDEKWMFSKPTDMEPTETNSIDTKLIDESLRKVYTLLDAAESNKKELRDALLSVDDGKNLDNIWPYVYEYYAYSVKIIREKEMDTLKKMVTLDPSIQSINDNAYKLLKKEDEMLDLFYKHPRDRSVHSNKGIPKTYSALTTPPEKKYYYRGDTTITSAVIMAYFDNISKSKLFSEIKDQLLALTWALASANVSNNEESEQANTCKTDSTDLILKTVKKLELSLSHLEFIQTEQQFYETFSELEKFLDIKKKKNIFDTILTEIENINHIILSKYFEIKNFDPDNKDLLFAMMNIFEGMYRIYQSVN